ncbi:PIN domain-containing protein [Priestia megaterium]
MNLTSNLLNRPKALLDTTVFISAIISPGVSIALLNAAMASRFQPVISNVCMWEFIRHASRGIKVGKTTISLTWDEIVDFLDYYVFPALQDQEITNSTVSRENFELIRLLTETTTLEQAIHALSSVSKEQAAALLEREESKVPLYRYDINDAHVWMTAIETKCDFIVTSNSNKFPEYIGNIRRIHPVEFAKLIDV